MRAVKDTVTAEGYSASLGLAVQSREEAEIGELTKQAEQAMYSEKSSYYAKSSHNRRKR
jgi:GGDEF domain-containing protein